MQTLRSSVAAPAAGPQAGGAQRGSPLMPPAPMPDATEAAADEQLMVPVSEMPVDDSVMYNSVRLEDDRLDSSAFEYVIRLSPAAWRAFNAQAQAGMSSTSRAGGAPNTRSGSSIDADRRVAELIHANLHVEVVMFNGEQVRIYSDDVPHFTPAPPLDISVTALDREAGTVTLGIQRNLPLSSSHMGAKFRLAFMLEAPGHLPCVMYSEPFRVLAKMGRRGSKQKQVHMPRYERLDDMRAKRLTYMLECAGLQMELFNAYMNDPILPPPDLMSSHLGKTAQLPPTFTFFRDSAYSASTDVAGVSPLQYSVAANAEGGVTAAPGSAARRRGRLSVDEEDEEDEEAHGGVDSAEEAPGAASQSGGMGAAASRARGRTPPSTGTKRRRSSISGASDEDDEASLLRRKYVPRRRQSLDLPAASAPGAVATPPMKPMSGGGLLPPARALEPLRLPVPSAGMATPMPHLTVKDGRFVPDVTAGSASGSIPYVAPTTVNHVSPFIPELGDTTFDLMRSTSMSSDALGNAKATPGSLVSPNITPLPAAGPAGLPIAAAAAAASTTAARPPVPMDRQTSFTTSLLHTPSPSPTGSVYSTGPGRSASVTAGSPVLPPAEAPSTTAVPSKLGFLAPFQLNALVKQPAAESNAAPAASDSALIGQRPHGGGT